MDKISSSKDAKAEEAQKEVEKLAKGNRDAEVKFARPGNERAAYVGS